MDNSLKDEWLEKIKQIKNRNVSKGYGFFSVMTSFYEAPEEIRLDKEITMKVLLESNEFIWNIHEKFKGDKQFILDLLQLDYKQDIYRGLPYELQKDEEIFELCIERDKKLREYEIPENIRSNRDLILKAAKKFNLMDIITDLYKYDKEINLVSFQAFPESWNQITKRIKNHLVKDKSVLIQVVTHFNAYSSLPLKNLVDPDIIEAALLKDIFNFSYIPEQIRNNKNYILETFKKYNHRLKIHMIPESFRSDYDIVKAFVQHDPQTLYYVNDDLKNNKELALLSIPSEPSFRFSYISSELKNDDDIVETFLKINFKNNFPHVPARFKTKEYSLAYLKLEPYMFQIIPKIFQNDFDFALIAVNIDKSIYSQLPKHLRENYEIIYEHIKNQNFIEKHKIEGQFDKTIFAMDSDNFKSFIHKNALTQKLLREEANSKKEKNDYKRMKI